MKTSYKKLISLLVSLSFVLSIVHIAVNAEIASALTFSEDDIVYTTADEDHTTKGEDITTTDEDETTGDEDTDKLFPTTVTTTIEEGDTVGVDIDLIKMFPKLAKSNSWLLGVEVDFTYEIDGLVEAVEGYGVGAGSNAELYAKYGKYYRNKSKNIWAYDVNWLADNHMEFNTAKLQFSTAGAEIMEAGLRLYNFQQEQGGDLDDYIIGKEIKITILDVRVGGISLCGGTISPVDSDGPIDIDTDTEEPADADSESESSGPPDGPADTDYQDTDWTSEEEHTDTDTNTNTDTAEPPTDGSGNSPAANTLTYADLDGDGRIDVCDITLLSSAIVKNSTLTSGQSRCADLNGDGNLDMFDMVMMRQIIINGGNLSMYAFYLRLFKLSIG